MNKKLLMTASTFSHIMHFHLPYIKKFKDLGWEVHVACGGKMQNIPLADKCVKLPLKKHYLSLENFKTIFVLKKLYKENNYDLIIAHTTLASFFTRFAEKGLKPHPKTINVVHGYLFDDKTPFIKSAILKMCECIVSNETDKIITMNEYDTVWAKKMFPKKNVARILGMGIRDDITIKNCSDLTINENDEVTLIYLAEFSKRKNQKMLIEAMSLLPKNVKLILAGEGDLLDECKICAKKIGVENNVCFAGFVTNTKMLLTKVDIAVSASSSEGLPFNVLEAMLSKLPVIASDVKGNNDLVQNGITGFLYPYNDKNAFADAVKKLIADKTAIKTMGENAHQIAQKYTLSHVLTNVMTEYLN